MKLVATRPVTIYRADNSVVINPHLLRHPSGTLFLWIEDGHDSHFTPVFRMHSQDNGLTWVKDGQNVPRMAAAHAFADGELFEMDTYGYWDPKTEDTYYHYGAWSHPEKPNDQARRANVKLRAPGHGRISARQIHKQRCYPNYPWWPLFNEVMGKAECTQDELFMGGAYMTEFLEHDGRLLGLGYSWDAMCCSVCWESTDRGHTWEKKSVVARYDGPTAPGDFGFSETSLVHLKDGRLYGVMRTDIANNGHVLHHVWSSDGGKTWTKPERLQIVDEKVQSQQQLNWPRLRVLADGTLILTYGRPGKHVCFDPSGTGNQWQGHLDLHAWELETQAIMGVPPELRLHGDTARCIRYWDSMDYLAVEVIGPREMIVMYDVQEFHENWNATPFSGIRMVRVRLE